MKKAIRKSPIPPDHVCVVNDLRDAHFDPHWHFHPEYQLFVVLEGTGTRFVGDQVKPFAPGDTVLTGPNLPHLWRSDDVYFAGCPEVATRGIVAYFHQDFLGNAFWQKEEVHEIKQLLERSAVGLEFHGTTAQVVADRMIALTTATGFDRVIQLLQLLYLLARATYYPMASVGYTSDFNETDTERMSNVHNFVMQHFRQPIRLSEVASLASMTPTSFSRYFKTHANKTFSDFVSEIRIGHACKLLLKDRLSVTQVCYECGFRTLSNFNRQFKRLTHKSPLAYKKAYAKVVRG